MKKGLFERMGLVERTESEENHQGYDDTELDDYSEEVEEEVDAEVDGVQTDTLIHDIYYENGCDDMSKSIFKVEEISATLPTTMPTESKRETVKGILSSFGITVDAIKDDADERIGIVKSACNKLCNAESDEIKTLEAQVEELCREAEAKRKEIQEHNTRLTKIIEESQAELRRIAQLRSFITGEPVAEKE